MTISVNTKASALTALENLTQTQQSLDTTQNEVSSGLAIASAQDNAAVWAIAQQQKAQVNALGSVVTGLNRATSIADVALTAGTTVSNLLNELSQKALAASDTSLDAASRSALNTDYQSLLQSLASTVDNASFDGINILNGSQPADLQFMANFDGTSSVPLSLQTLTLGGSLVTMAATSDIATATDASAVLAQINASVANVNAAMSSLGDQANEIQSQASFVAQLSDTFNTGIGNLVDADMAQEAAKLQALQVQQQLGVQALSVANSAPAAILALFSQGAASVG
jgi:flagellin